MNDEVQIIVYDLDVLVNLEFECIKKILDKTHKHLKIRLPNDLEKKTIWYTPKRENILKNNFHAESDDYLDALNKYYTIKNIKNEAKVVSDIWSLKTIKKPGRRIGILASMHPEIANYEINLVKKFLAKKCLVNDAIDEVMVAWEYGITNKTNPKALKLLLEKLEIDTEKERAFLVGDTDLDVLAANNAKESYNINIEPVLIDREHNRDNILELKPHYKFKTLYQVECYA